MEGVRNPQVGEELLGGGRLLSCVAERDSWQIWRTRMGYALVVTRDLQDFWSDMGYVEPGLFLPLGADLLFVESTEHELISSAELGPVPVGSQQIMAVARAFAYTRSALGDVSLETAIFLPRLPHLLPTSEAPSSESDALTLGRWLSGGMDVPVTDASRMCSWVAGMSEAVHAELLALFGWERSESERIRVDGHRATEAPKPRTQRRERGSAEPFHLAGRTELERFFRERIIDVIDREDEYRRMGISFPGPTLLVGPPGCGKTFAVERLVEYLGWPSYVVNADSVGSSYIHETSKLISQLFAQAMEDAPSVVVMDEMEAFLSDRSGTSGSHQYHVEEMAEFLRIIPELPKHRVLLFGMTNVPERIDKAIMRKGRFDHTLEVGMPSAEELVSLLKSLLKDVPIEPGISYERLARRLANRPISDVAYVAKEAGRLAVVERRDRVGEDLLMRACDDLMSQAGEGKPKQRIGFF